MPSSGDIWVINKIADLSNRFGVSPTKCDVGLEFTTTGDFDSYYYLRGIDEPVRGDENDEKIKKVWSALGLDGSGFRRFDTLEEVEKVVDHALALAPRTRIR